MESDNISPTELSQILLKNKTAVVLFAFFAFIFSLIYVINLPDTYTTDIKVLPTERGNTALAMPNVLSSIAPLIGSANMGMDKKVGRALARIHTYDFLIKYINNNKMKPLLFPDEWNAQDESWIDAEPSTHQAANRFKRMISIEYDPMNSLLPISIIIKWKQPYSITNLAKLTNELIETLNKGEQNRNILKYSSSIEYLKKRLSKTDLISTQIIINSMIERNMTDIMLAETRGDYTLIVVDPALIPLNKDKSLSFIIVFVSTLFGLFIGSLYVINRKNIKENRE